MQAVVAAGIAAARAFLALRFPSLAGAPLLGSEVCQYEASPDSHFVIDRHPDHDNVVIASPCSGHGFKYTTAIGPLLAELAFTGRTTLAIDSFSIGRFAPIRTGTP